MTTKEEKEERKKREEDQEKKFPVAITNCPNCRKTIFFSAGEAEQACDCGITVYRMAKE